MKIALYLPRQLRWPITWGTAFGSLGLALLAGPATTSSTAGPPNQAQAVAHGLASSPGFARDADDDANDAADEDDEPAGKVRIGGLAPVNESDHENELPPRTVRGRDDRPARPSLPFWTRKPRAPKASLVRRSPRSKCVTPLDQRPANMTMAVNVVPADSGADADFAESSDPSVALSKSQSLPQSELSQRPLSADDEVDDGNGLVDSEVPPAMSLEQGAEAADNLAEAAATASEEEDPAFVSLTDDPPLVSLSSAGECPATDDNIDALVNRIHEDDIYNDNSPKPIGKLRADMRTRLPNRHSILWNLREKTDDNDQNQRASTRERVVIHEKVRCDVESERQAIRADYKSAYGPYFDRSTGGGSDENVAPLFPYTYNPLYFEDPNLERCGYSLGCCAQPFVSMAHFYGNVALFPVKALVLRPWECVYPQADCEPCTRYGCLDNILGPCPETTGWGCFKSRRYSCKTSNGGSW